MPNSHLVIGQSFANLEALDKRAETSKAEMKFSTDGLNTTEEDVVLFQNNEADKLVLG